MADNSCPDSVSHTDQAVQTLISALVDAARLKPEVRLAFRTLAMAAIDESLDNPTPQLVHFVLAFASRQAIHREGATFEGLTFGMNSSLPSARSTGPELSVSNTPEAPAQNAESDPILATTTSSIAPPEVIVAAVVVPEPSLPTRAPADAPGVPLTPVIAVAPLVRSAPAPAVAVGETTHQQKLAYEAKGGLWMRGALISRLQCLAYLLREKAELMRVFSRVRIKGKKAAGELFVQAIELNSELSIAPLVIIGDRVDAPGSFRDADASKLENRLSAAAEWLDALAEFRQHAKTNRLYSSPAASELFARAKRACVELQNALIKYVEDPKRCPEIAAMKLLRDDFAKEHRPPNCNSLLDTSSPEKFMTRLHKGIAQNTCGDVAINKARAILEDRQLLLIGGESRDREIANIKKELNVRDDNFRWLATSGGRRPEVDSAVKWADFVVITRWTAHATSIPALALCRQFDKVWAYSNSSNPQTIAQSIVNATSGQ